ncbi:hypothetical protein BGW36DRAFT_429254 [Talaromyces proteolyticus]|uniref:Uncharacterized protein n=1 Tax=Talaromyces proteolyticus TaxID=1131652 RepID=A0AAD4KLH7_9EURO|nr:uncharacterized protein BGW36DRAFT_429254 [Talaromyces proteolyticus]KAH8695374.1 hypothetical protein BGW36DRAFT_429254 [Talaromyces proteolyticus]
MTCPVVSILHQNFQKANAQPPCLYLALTSLFSPALYSVIISLCKPVNFNWREYLRIQPLGSHNYVSIEVSGVSDKNVAVQEDVEIKVQEDQPNTSVAMEITIVPLDYLEHPFNAETIYGLHRWLKINWVTMFVGILITWFAWPLSLYRDYIFSKSFFTGWVVVAVIGNSLRSWRWWCILYGPARVRFYRPSLVPMCHERHW